jgi:DNA polymerase
MLNDLAALSWLVEMGAAEAIARQPVDRFAPRPQPRAAPGPAPAPMTAPAPAMASAAARRPAEPAPRDDAPAAGPTPSAQAAASAAELAAGARTLDELETALRGFDGCSLKATATTTVFADGVPGSRVMFVGEAPGADEDRIGRPFVGVSGQLLDTMLRWIDLDRGRNVYIANVVYWRPPGNRPPTTAELAICLPFIRRQIELANPELLVFLGNSAAQALLGTTGGISRMRGRWIGYRPPGADREVQAMATFHPAYLLRSPAQKRESWRDLLMIKNKLSSGANELK